MPNSNKTDNYKTQLDFYFLFLKKQILQYKNKENMR